jgi:hypothetical protein
MLSARRSLALQSALLREASPNVRRNLDHSFLRPKSEGERVDE